MDTFPLGEYKVPMPISVENVREHGTVFAPSSTGYSELPLLHHKYAAAMSGMAHGNPKAAQIHASALQNLNRQAINDVQNP